MPVINCPIPECTYATEDVEVAIAAALLVIHNNVHVSNSPVSTDGTSNRPSAPKIDRPKVSTGTSEETWITFSTRWSMFKRGASLRANEAVHQLFQCCETDLGDALLRANPNIADGTEEELLAAIKQMAVVPVAVSVRRAGLLTSSQDHGENIRAFYAKVRGKAATCAYSIKCTNNACSRIIDFTDTMVKDVVIAGLADEDIKKEVLGWSELDESSLNDTIRFVEAKEMARDALSKQSTNAGLSSYKKNMQKPKVKVSCKECKTEIDKFIWNKRMNKMIECSLCLPCWKKANPKKGQAPKDDSKTSQSKDETSALLFLSSISSAEVSAGISVPKISLDHHIFYSYDGWKKSESLAHPTLRLRLTTHAEDYHHFEKPCPRVMPSFVTAVTDTGAQSCLWSQQDFYRCGFRDSDLLPVNRTIVAANREEISISGVIFIRLSGTDAEGKTHTAPIMTYVSPSTRKFYLSREALIQLRVIPKDFPQVGATNESASIETKTAACGCPRRTLPPDRPQKLPFQACKENIESMKSWLGEKYNSSTFNKCTHQVLCGITGPDLHLHVDPKAKPKAVHTPSTIPMHWEKEVKKQLDDDVNLGVLEKVPHGQPSLWCHRMVVTRKADGKPRRTVDMSTLNKVCLRETHHVKPPFHQAKSIPQNTWKTVTDAWNGFHSVPLAEEDRQYTTFITPWGRYRYRMAPQGALGSGDGYSRRYDEVIADVQRKTKCVDDTAQWDDDLQAHWWRVIDYLELCGKNGVTLNFEKFQFSQREIDFAGFRVTEQEVKPLDKYLRAIAEFPTPTRTTDIRSWFGLVHQVSHYAQLTTMLKPFKKFLSPRVKFEWNEELNDAFESSKKAIIDAIKEGVQIYDLEKPTCLRTDFSKDGIGYFLSQKHCNCNGSTPGCCDFGWRITLAGSRFLKPSESRYSPVEGEAKAITWSLDHTKYFTQGCDNLVVVTDHKPLVPFFTSRTLDQIENPRLFSLKQHTLPWRFVVVHKPGKDNPFSDATSRNPILSPEEDVSNSEALAGIMVYEENGDDCAGIAYHDDTERIRAVTWDVVRQETERDQRMQLLFSLINSTFPTDKCEMPQDLLPYWAVRNNLYTVDGIILMKDQVLIPSALRGDIIRESLSEDKMRIVIPPSLRKEIIRTLHSAHQGVSGMNERAKASVYWPGITKDIQLARDSCHKCNTIMPSQPRLPPIEPLIPTTPFEAIACDYFHLIGHHYLIAADRLSGWFEVQLIKMGTNEAGAEGLCKALRRLMVTFGVPVEMSSDGGPEFIAAETNAFLKRWGIRHRLSSVSLPSSNGRAELAVKTAKRLLMGNVNANGQLDTDSFARALLTYRNTPDPGCKLSPAQILLGRPLRDTLPYLQKELMIFNNKNIHPEWKQAWRAKEEALRTRYAKSMENLSEHAYQLPPLRHGDHVFIQNQQGRYPKKWDKSGVVVETKEHDQYVVKVSGTGRLTLRNRRFLRKYDLDLQHVVPMILPQPFVKKPTVNPRASMLTENAKNDDTGPNWTPVPVNQQIERNIGLSDHGKNPVVYPTATTQDTPLVESEPTSAPLTGSSTVPPTLPSTGVPSSANVNPRPQRTRKERLFYDASTGKNAARATVPEEL